MVQTAASRHAAFAGDAVLFQGVGAFGVLALEQAAIHEKLAIWRQL